MKRFTSLLALLSGACAVPSPDAPQAVETCNLEPKEALPTVPLIIIIQDEQLRVSLEAAISMFNNASANQEPIFILGDESDIGQPGTALFHMGDEELAVWFTVWYFVEDGYIFTVDVSVWPGASEEAAFGHQLVLLLGRMLGMYGVTSGCVGEGVEAILNRSHV